MTSMGLVKVGVLEVLNLVSISISQCLGVFFFGVIGRIVKVGENDCCRVGGETNDVSTKWEN